MSDNEKYYHDKGEKDASKGRYDPPPDAGDFWTWSSSGMDKNQKENDAYHKGYYHTKGQMHRKEGRYDPPSGGDSRKAYDSGYSNSSSGSSSSGGCFITTATLISIGKSDECEELNAFRSFRDNWLSKQSDGEKLIKEYYKIAPTIVTAINSNADSKRIYCELWIGSIEPCLTLIRQSRFTEAKAFYSKTVADLKRKFVDK